MQLIAYRNGLHDQIPLIHVTRRTCEGRSKLLEEMVKIEILKMSGDEKDSGLVEDHIDFGGEDRVEEGTRLSEAF